MKIALSLLILIFALQLIAADGWPSRKQAFNGIAKDGTETSVELTPGATVLYGKEDVFVIIIINDSSALKASYNDWEVGLRRQELFFANVMPGWKGASQALCGVFPRIARESKSKRIDFTYNAMLISVKSISETYSQIEFSKQNPPPVKF